MTGVGNPLAGHVQPIVTIDRHRRCAAPSQHWACRTAVYRREQIAHMCVTCVTLRTTDLRLNESHHALRSAKQTFASSALGNHSHLLIYATPDTASSFDEEVPLTSMLPQQQTQVQVTKFSKLPKLEGLEVIKGDVPQPKEGEVLCQIVLRPVNPTDVHAIQGLRPIGPHHTPHIAGGEGERSATSWCMYCMA